MPAKPLIRCDFTHGLEGDLLHEVRAKFVRDKLIQKRDSVYVSQFQRFGLSGANLLLFYFNREPEGVPHLLKVTSYKKAKKELDATQRVGNLIQDAVLEEKRVFQARDSDGEKHGALLYFHRGSFSEQGAKKPDVLRELIYKRGFALSKVRRILESVFNKLYRAHSKQTPREVVLEKHYKDYLRQYHDGAEPQLRIRRILAPTTLERLTFLGAPIYNPLKFVNLLRGRATLEIAPIHGDLHPDNIVIDRDGAPHLIDFAWADQNRDVLLDFVLLENSIRFMAFPRPINLNDQLKVDRALLEEDGYGQIKSLDLSAEEHREDYERLAGAVQVIRRKARACLKGRFSMQRYLLTQFIVLYGLLRYENYEPYTGTRALGLIAAHLKSIGLPT